MLKNGIQLSTLDSLVNCDLANFDLVSQITVRILSSKAEAIVRCLVYPEQAESLFQTRVILIVCNWTHLSVNERVPQ